MGGVSLVGCLLQQPFKYLPQAPCGRRVQATNVHPRDLAVHVDYHGLWNRVDLESLADLIVWIEQHGQPPLSPREELGDSAGIFSHIDPEQLHPLRVERIDSIDQVRERLHARATPGGPEIEHHDLARMVGQIERITANQFGRELVDFRPDQWVVEAWFRGR